LCHIAAWPPAELRYLLARQAADIAESMTIALESLGMPRLAMGSLPDGLILAIDCALLAWLPRVARYDAQTMRRRGAAAASIVGSYGDALQYGGRHRHDGRDVISLWLELRDAGADDGLRPAPTCGEVFNALAEGVAIGERCMLG
jgi:hypothetical protein